MQRDNDRAKQDPSPLKDAAAAVAWPVTGTGEVQGLRRLVRSPVGKAVLFIISLLLFVQAIAVMKEGARAVAPWLQSRSGVNNPANSLGFGWVAAYLMLSGSPVAAAALTFLDAGAIDQFSALTMITGSRLGASLIVLLLGIIYVLRGRNRATNLSMGLLSLAVTGSTNLIALILGAALLARHALADVYPRSGLWISLAHRVIFERVLAWVAGLLPTWTLFPLGLGLILISFQLFDRCLPQMAIRESQVGRVSRVIYRPWVMFLLGSGVTLISMSVSVSLSVLLPLSNRGFVRRENAIPYIMGANVTTFIDTLIAAVLLNNPLAFTVVLVQMVSVAAVCMLILLVGYYAYERGLLAFVTWVIASNRNLVFFMVVIILVPLALLLL